LLLRDGAPHTAGNSGRREGTVEAISKELRLKSEVEEGF
jgi:hypothetical protein